MAKKNKRYPVLEVDSQGNITDAYKQKLVEADRRAQPKVPTVPKPVAVPPPRKEWK